MRAIGLWIRCTKYLVGWWIWVQYYILCRYVFNMMISQKNPETLNRVINWWIQPFLVAFRTKLSSTVHLALQGFSRFTWPHSSLSIHEPAILDATSWMLHVLPPQDLCTCYFLCLETSLPHGPLVYYYLSFRFQFKFHFFWEAVSSTPLYSQFILYNFPP